MDKSTIAIGIVVAVIVVGVVVIASRSPAAQSSLTDSLGLTTPTRDHTAEDAAGIMGGIGDVLSGAGDLIGSFYGGGVAAAAGGKSSTGVK